MFNNFIRYILTALVIFAYLTVIPKVFASDPVGNWNITTPLPYLLASHSSIAANNRLYFFGGATSDDYDQVYSSSINNGVVSGWGLVNILPETRYRLSTAISGNNVYVLGGVIYDGSETYKNTVYLSKLQPNGDLSSWQSVSDLPAPRSLGRAVVIGNKIYYAGGLDQSQQIHDEIYMADINSDGTLGSWTLAGHLSQAARSFGMVEYQNHIVVTGGDILGGISDKAYKADINPDGSVGVFQDLGSMPQQISGAQVLRVGNILVSVGGGDNFGITNKTYYATINGDGTLGSWSTSSSLLPQGIGAGSIAYANGYLYLTGGVGSIDGYTDKVYSSKFTVEPLLNVPLLKQTDPAWKNNVYDTSNVWAPSDPTINAWGCALTSAAMVFKYYGINKLPGNINLDPGTLNVWLKGQADGYVGNGLVNWMALARLSKLAKGINPTFTAGDALEYSRYGFNKIQLTTDLNNNIPGILEEPGHFIVAKGVSGSTFTINDPFYARTDLTPYSNSFISLNRFVPSHTDLSYIMVVGDPSVNVILKTATGSAVGESFIQQPLDHDGGTGNSGNSVKILLLQQPTGGNYSITTSATTNKTYQLKIFLYDKDGNVKLVDGSGIVGPQDTDSYSIKFDKNSSNNDTTTQTISFDSFIADINSLYLTHDIDIYNKASLLIQTQTAKNYSVNKITKLAATIPLLKDMDKQVIKEKGKGVSINAYNILHADIQSLLASL